MRVFHAGDDALFWQSVNKNLSLFAGAEPSLPTAIEHSRANSISESKAMKHKYVEKRRGGGGEFMSS